MSTTRPEYKVKQNAANGLWYSYYGGGVLPTQVACVGAETVRQATNILMDLIENGATPAGSITLGGV
jgi:hypothetical protein